MKSFTILGLFSLFNSSAQAFDIILPRYPTRIIEPQLNNCNSAFIYAETDGLALSLEENKHLFQEQTQYLNKFLLSPVFKTNVKKNNGIMGFKGQNSFIKTGESASSIFMGQNERLIRTIMKKPKLDIPEFDLDLLALETMLNSLTIIMVFDITQIDSFSKFYFRNGYPFEYIMHHSQKYSLQDIPVMAVADKVIGSPFLPQHQLPISKDTKKILISIFQMGKNTFFDLKEFNSVTNQFIHQAQNRCHLEINKVTLFKGYPIIDNIHLNHDSIKLFTDTNGNNLSPS
ncbi:MAG: hypothetical protein EBQ95_01640 [Gammaproteobacteria bacterium]|nr:hypothetical protein [Gammaproteobacteria bacterium]